MKGTALSAISKLGCKGCTVDFPGFLRCLVLPGAFSRRFLVVAE